MTKSENDSGQASLAETVGHCEDCEGTGWYGARRGWAGIERRMTMSEPKRCDKDGMCKFLEERMSDGGKGFRAIHTIKLDPTAESLPMQWRGVSYHSSAKDRGLLVNFCPWCGGKPGDLANRDTPNNSGQRPPASGGTSEPPCSQEDCP